MPTYAETFGPAAGIFWWNIQLVNYIISPNRRLAAMKRRYKQLLGWPTTQSDKRSVLGVHVRHGDACADWRQGVMHHSELMPRAFCLDFERHVIPAIDQMVRSYGIRHVFVSTDDPEVLAHIRRRQEGRRMLPCGAAVQVAHMLTYADVCRRMQTYADVC